MALDCVISVPGMDQGYKGHGVLKKTKTGPLSEFLKDSELYYRAVWKHVKSCGKCDPAEVLRGFLENRNWRQRGQTSTLLVEMAEKYARNLPERVPPELVREFVIRSMTSWETFERRTESLSSAEIVRAHDLYMASWKEEVLASANTPRRPNGQRTRRSWPFARAQGSVGWLNDKERAHLGREVPEPTMEAASLSEEEAMVRGGWDLTVWLITRHTWETAMEDPDMRYVLAVELAEEVMEA